MNYILNRSKLSDNHYEEEIMMVGTKEECTAKMNEMVIRLLSFTNAKIEYNTSFADGSQKISVIVKLVEEGITDQYKVLDIEFEVRHRLRGESID